MSSVIRFNINMDPKDPTKILDDGKLISLVKKEEFLWNFHHKNYKTINLRNIAWKSIGLNLNQDSTICQKRWKAIRERYCIHFRKFQETNLKPKWDFFDDLDFLNPFVNFKDKSMASEEVDSENDSNENLEEINKKIDLEKFINLVKERRNLYDKSCENFRNSSERRKTWDEIGRIMNCKGSYCQKKWRTQRDRFVRELRRSKNSQAEFHCTNFFRNMLFLTQHVRAKSYSAEVKNITSPESEPDYSYCDNENEEIFDHQDLQETEYSSEVGKTDYNAEESSFDGQEISGVISDANDEFEDADYMEMEGVDENGEMEEYEEEIIDPEESIKEEFVLNEEMLSSSSNKDKEKDEELLVEIKSETVPEENVDINEIDDISLLQKRQNFKTNPLNSDANHAFATDEDTAFGNMLVCMLKKIPNHLKIQVKLKLMQSLADFEKEHNLC